MCMKGFVAKAYAGNAVIGFEGCLDPACHQAMLAPFLVLKLNFNVASISDPDSSRSF